MSTIIRDEQTQKRECVPFEQRTLSKRSIGTLKMVNSNISRAVYMNLRGYVGIWAKLNESISNKKN